jgi:hypothetical protein
MKNPSKPRKPDTQRKPSEPRKPDTRRKPSEPRKPEKPRKPTPLKITKEGFIELLPGVCTDGPVSLYALQEMVLILRCKDQLPALFADRLARLLRFLLRQIPTTRAHDRCLLVTLAKQSRHLSVFRACEEASDLATRGKLRYAGGTVSMEKGYYAGLEELKRSRAARERECRAAVEEFEEFERERITVKNRSKFT